MRKNKSRKKITKKRRNALLFPMYKMFSWDLLSYYPIEFLFYTITKGLLPSQVLILTSIYLTSKILFQIPAVAITDYIGKKRSIIIGNLFIILYITLLIKAQNIYLIILANVLVGIGFNLKGIAEGNLLYDSVATRGRRWNIYQA